MLQTKLQDHWPFVPQKILKIVTVYGHGGHLGHGPGPFEQIFVSPVPRRAHMKFGFNRPSGFRGDV